MASAITPRGISYDYVGGVAVRRTPSTVRGTRVPGESGRPPKPKPELCEPEEVENPKAPRRIVDHKLARRAALAKTALVAAGASDHLDPHPYLLRAARNHGEPVDELCPYCRGRETLVHLRYVYGDELGPYSGRLRTATELDAMATRHGAFRVYLVEVCQACGWNHLVVSYVLGDGKPRQALRASRDMLA